MEKRSSRSKTRNQLQLHIDHLNSELKVLETAQNNKPKKSKATAKGANKEIELLKKATI